jgi:hypothetical protein
MNRIIFAIVTLLSVGFALASCNKDTSEEEILKNQLATADSLLKRGGVIKYTVKIVSTANSSILKSKMSIENANVTIYQNDKVYTAITDANGFAIFPDMRIGTAAVNVKLKDHAEVDYIADLTPADNLINLSQGQMVNTVRYASTMVPMFPIAAPGAATITGKVTAELDLTNTAPEPAPNVTVTAKVDVDDPDFVSRYITPTQGTTNSNAGRIIKFAFQDATISTQTDAQGNYTLQVPAALNGLPIKLSVADYQTNQKLYLENDPTDGSFKPGEYTVPVIFSTGLQTSEIPVVKTVYATISEPDSPIGITYKPAKFTFEVDVNGSITKVNVVDKGKYSCKPAVVAYLKGKNASFNTNFNSNTGEIESIDIINGGVDYAINSSYIGAYVSQNIRIAKIDLPVDQNGNISNAILLDKGYGYVNNATINIISLNKTAILPTFEITTTPWNQEISSIKLLSIGKSFKSVGNTPANKKELTVSNLNIKEVLSNQIVTKNIYLGTGNK